MGAQEGALPEMGMFKLRIGNSKNVVRQTKHFTANSLCILQKDRDKHIRGRMVLSEVYR